MEQTLSQTLRNSAFVKRFGLVGMGSLSNVEGKERLTGWGTLSGDGIRDTEIKSHGNFLVLIFYL